MYFACFRSRNATKEETVVLTGEDAVEQARRYAAEDAEFRCFACALKLAIAYASNVGGTGTMIGCGSNIVLKGMGDS